MTSSFGGLNVTGSLGANFSFFGCSEASDMVNISEGVVVLRGVGWLLKASMGSHDVDLGMEVGLDAIPCWANCKQFRFVTSFLTRKLFRHDNNLSASRPHIFTPMLAYVRYNQCIVNYVCAPCADEDTNSVILG